MEHDLYGGQRKVWNVLRNHRNLPMNINNAMQKQCKNETMRKAFSETVYQQLEDLEQISNEEKEQI